MNPLDIRILQTLTVHKLVEGNGGSDNSDEAIKDLIKILNGKEEDLNSLIVGVVCNGEHATKCIRIKRSDVQIDVKSLIRRYCRIWRWADLGDAKELQHIDFQDPFDRKEEICFNPYHYEKMSTPEKIQSGERQHSDIGSKQQPSDAGSDRLQSVVSSKRQQSDDEADFERSQTGESDNEEHVEQSEKDESDVEEESEYHETKASGYSGEEEEEETAPARKRRKILSSEEEQSDKGSDEEQDDIAEEKIHSDNEI